MKDSADDDDDKADEIHRRPVLELGFIANK